MTEIRSGILNIYKEVGWTSFDVVAKLRGIMRIKKIGHAGTLDPAAEGVLPVCIGRATRIAELLSDETKAYRAKMRLGIETDTLDQTGTVLRTADPNLLAKATGQQIREAAALFEGGYDQIPPMYSAKHVNGKRLYDLAREGKTVERRPVRVRIDEIGVEEIDMENGPLVVLKVTCGRGTYIRSLIADIGDKLGCGAVMTELVRTRVGPFDIGGALTVGQVEAAAGDRSDDSALRAGRLAALMTPVDQVFSHMPAAAVSESCRKLALNGNKIPVSGIRFESDCPGAGNGRDMFRLYDPEGVFIGVFRLEDESGKARPVKMFYPS